jgi:uncharacterized protein
MNELVRIKKDQIEALCKKHFVKKLYLFGSALTDSFNKDSDVDFFYEIGEEKNAPGFDYASNIFSLEDALAELLGRKVDLIRHDGSYPQLLLKAIGNKKVLLYAE